MDYGAAWGITCEMLQAAEGLSPTQVRRKQGQEPVPSVTGELGFWGAPGNLPFQTSVASHMKFPSISEVFGWTPTVYIKIIPAWNLLGRCALASEEEQRLPHLEYQTINGVVFVTIALANIVVTV